MSEIDATWSKLNEKISATTNAHDLGVALHTAQDFYAHSNYVELYIQYYEGNGGDISKLKPGDIPLYQDASSELKKFLGENGLKTGEFHFIDDAVFQNGKNDSDKHHSKIAKDKSDKHHGSDKVRGSKSTFFEFAAEAATEASKRIIEENLKNIEE